MGFVLGGGDCDGGRERTRFNTKLLEGLMLRAELTPAGVMCPEETVGFIAKGCEYVQWRSKTGALDIPAEHSLEMLSPGFPFSPGSFLSFLQHSLEILLLPPHRCPGVPLPFPSSAPSSDFPMPT